MNVLFQQFRMFKVCAKNTENRKSRDKQNNNNSSKTHIHTNKQVSAPNRIQNKKMKKNM